MKIIKYFFLLIFLIAIATTVFVATQDGKYDIKKERTIKLQPAVVYNYINDYQNWKYIGILTDNDTIATYAFGNKTAGKDALATWKHKNSQGRIKTLKAIENDSIIQKAVINGQESDVKWLFKKTANGTSVSVRVKGNLTFMDKAYALFNNSIHDRLDEVVAKGLQNLDVFLVKELTVYNTQVNSVVNKKPVFYLKQTVTDSTADIHKTISAIIVKLNTFVKTNKIATNGAPFTMYKYNGGNKKSAVFSVCIPIKEEIVTALGSEFEGGRLNGFNALKVTLKGDYAHAEKAWNAGKRYIVTNSLPENIDGDYLEVYTKAISQTKRPSKLITDYYLPVGPRTGSLTDTLTIVAPPVLTPQTAAAVNTIIGNTGKYTTPAKPKPEASTPAKPAGTTSKPAGTSTAPKPASTGRSTSTPTNGSARAAGSTTAKPSDKPKTAGNTTTGTTGNKPHTSIGTTTAKPATTPAAKPAQTTPAAAKPIVKPAVKPVRTLPDEFN